MANMQLKAETVYLRGPEHLAFKVAAVLRDQDKSIMPRTRSVVVHEFRVMNPPVDVHLAEGEVWVEVEYVETSCGFAVQ